MALYMEKPITSIEAEFRNIATSTVRIDELPVGVESKNRYANVLPVPETRVHIRVQDNQPTDTIEQYINANYIKVRSCHNMFFGLTRLVTAWRCHAKFERVASNNLKSNNLHTN